MGEGVSDSNKVDHTGGGVFTVSRAVIWEAAFKSDLVIISAVSNRSLSGIFGIERIHVVRLRFVNYYLSCK